jgi:hypothetical protein
MTERSASTSQREKEDHEDRALNTLIRTLAGLGHDALIVTHPDRDPSHPLTVDALLNIDGTEWAVDHFLLSRDNRIPGARRSTEKRLRPALETIARAAGIALSISYRPHAGSDAAVYCASVIDLARAAAADGRTRYAGDGCTRTGVWPHAPVGAVGLSPFLTVTGDAKLSHQIDEGVGATLEKKLTGQLRRAKETGYPVMLLLDGTPRPGVANDTIWMTAHPNTVRAAVKPHLDSHPGTVEVVWWVPWQANSAQLVLGSLPPAG